MAAKKIDETLVLLVERWRLHPYDFVVECLGVKPTPQQTKVLRALEKPGVKISIRSGHGTGKSTLFAWIILWALVCFWDVKVPVTAPTAHQLSDVIWPEVEKWHSKMLDPWKSSITIKNDKISMAGTPGFAAARTGRKENPEALQGFHADKVIFLIDEASGIAEVVFEAGRGALSTEGAIMVMAANPTRLTGYFYNSHHKNRDLFERFQFSCLDSPRVTRDYIEEIAAEYGEDSDMYRVRVLGDFPHASDLQFMPADLVEGAMGKHLRSDEYSFAPVIIGVDVAMFGGDRSVIMLRQGLMSKLLFQIKGIEPEKLASVAAMYQDEYKADAVVVDAIGIGQAVISALHLMNRTPISFNAAEKATLQNCSNMRAEVWYRMRDWFKEGGSIEDNSDLRDDLIGPEYGFNVRGKLCIEKKEEMKKRGLASPDLADALAVTFGALIIKKDPYESIRGFHVSPKNEWDEYNPLGL